MLPHLVEMFGERGENAPEWDRERRYKSADLRIYLSYKHPEDDRDVMLRLRTDLALVDQLVRAQAKGYAVPGIPILHVVVGGSEYERKYVLPAAL